MAKNYYFIFAAAQLQKLKTKPPRVYIFAKIKKQNKKQNKPKNKTKNKTKTKQKKPKNQKNQKTKKQKKNKKTKNKKKDFFLFWMIFWQKRKILAKIF